MSHLPKPLIKMLQTRRTKSLAGEEMAANDGIKESEALILLRMCEETKAVTTLETGLAFGASALVFTHYHQQTGNGGRHYAVDPNQLTNYKGAAVRLVNEAGLDGHFQLLDGPSHTELPKLIEAKVTLDCAFIDGWHTFDYTLVDFFMIDKMLRPGGMVAFHDMGGLAKQKVLRYVLSHRDYEVLKGYRIT